MKLYATITSERATKGQGGNKKLDYSLNVGTGQHDSHNILTVNTYYSKEEKIIYLSIGRPHEHFEEYQYNLKGELLKAKRQKGEQVKVKTERTFTQGNDWHD